VITARRTTGEAHAARFLHPGQLCRRAAAVNLPANRAWRAKLDRGEHRHTIQAGGNRYHHRSTIRLDSPQLLAATNTNHPAAGHTKM
jgi:hypothetical protein